MKRALALCFFAAVSFSPLVRAQSCSGGGDGGMDATGSQCNSPNELRGDTTQQPEAAVPISAARPLRQVASASGHAPTNRSAAAAVAAHRPDRPRSRVHAIGEQAAGR